jgi:hypothetical protein
MGIVFYVMWNWGKISTLSANTNVLSRLNNSLNYKSLTKMLPQPVHQWLTKPVGRYQT